MNYFYIIKMNNILELSDSIGFFLMISWMAHGEGDR